MDIYITDNIDFFHQKLKKLNFERSDKEGYFSGILKAKSGRYHLLYTEKNKRIFCDFHFDHSIHLLFLGVDYSSKPLVYFRQNIQPLLDAENIVYEIHEVNWFNRKNKAVLTGFKV